MEKKEKLVHGKFCNGVNQSKFNVFKLFFMNQINELPELICIERIN